MHSQLDYDLVLPIRVDEGSALSRPRNRFSGSYFALISLSQVRFSAKESSAIPGKFRYILA